MTAPSEWLDTLATLDDALARARFLAEHSLPGDAHTRLSAAVLQHLYSDRPKAARLAAAAALLDGDDAQALAQRSLGHLAYLAGDYAQASQHYETSAALFTSTRNEVELGRTLSSSLQALIYQSKYAEAEAAAARAEIIFQHHGDLLRLARLDSNVGNIYFRQDRPAEALARYQRALEGFEQCGEPRDIAAAYSNLATCSTSLGLFAEALSHYTQAREFCAANSLAPLLARADYNIAYLYYLRGDYAEARRLYDLTRLLCAQTGDAYHAALCDLDEAELYLELNLTREGEQLATAAAASFEKLKMPYEQAKALVSVAIAANQRGDTGQSDAILRQTRRLFVAERNPVWPALVDQLRAVLAFREQRFERAHRLSTSARTVLANATIPGRAAHSQILLARLWLRAGYADRARASSREALERLGADSSPSVHFHAALIEGEIHETQGRWSQALAAYEGARAQLEEMRGRLDTEDLRISVLADKLSVYEALVTLRLDAPPSAAPPVEAFACVQQAKSRTLADRLAASWRSSPQPPNSGSRIDELRKDLNWLYRQIDLASLLDRATVSTSRVGPLRERALALETEIVELDRLREGQPAGAPDADSLTSIQAALAPTEALLEYYDARGVLYLFLVTHDELRAIRLGSCAPIRQSMKLLQFQIQKMRIPAGGPQPSSAAATAHLRDLFTYLIAPALPSLQDVRHLVIAPYKNLHSLPFAALDDGERSLIDRFELSFSPSASVFARCRRRPAHSTGPSTVIAVPDDRAPRIAEEARQVAAILKTSNLFVGPDATLDALRRHGSGSRVLHMAAHGVFRRDNPLFSSIELADGRLNLIDLNAIDLNVDLLTLSACNTGSSVSIGGDELLGLIRGCLAAGARSLVVTLWEIDDHTATDFMRAFYTGVVGGLTLSAALAAAMRDLRASCPHPYFWAPYVLIGDPAPIQ